MSTPKYLRQTTTGLCFAYTIFKAQRPDMEPWTGPLPWESSEEARADEPAGAKDESPDGEINSGINDEAEKPPEKTREDLIREAVSMVDPSEYAGPAFGRPAMPKVADVEALCGLDDVSADEIIAALPKE